MAVPAIGASRLAILLRPSVATQPLLRRFLKQGLPCALVLVLGGPLLALTPSASGTSLLQGDDPK